MSGDNNPFISGQWYEDQYRDPTSRYGLIYNQPIPEWAAQANRYHAAAVAAWLALDLSSDPNVLDVGSGVGRYVAAWEGMGAVVQGVEISAEAVRLSGRPNIYVGSANNLPFNDGSFDLAFSAAVMEHIAAGVETAKVLNETMRCARYGAHYIPMEKGDDPSHIHIQSRKEWRDEIKAALGSGFWLVDVNNPAEPTQPLFLMGRVGDMPWPVQNYLEQRGGR